jgi:type VI secretion system secreted protein VgrG
MVLTPGVYFFASSAQLTGTLTLNDLGNPNAVFVFQIGSTLTTASSSSVIFSNSLTDKNVYWQVGSSATLGTSTSFQGNILALTSITLNTGASIGCGSALARNGAVTLDNNVIGGGCGSTTTVPEPGTMGLLGTGLAILIGSARRRLRI